ncbi:hypothetical protein SAMN05421862_10271 [Pseudomonas extremaustralis]|uniref:hypothetical protein n=1 Tax=Pseudomonas extremaustralis TaxID=359110 RepID=UPI0009C8C4D1|nr:hypothetical protein [Pseudomonas extremaustralis]SKA80393.1 hypothetical protein SAMN05421862_10271 [Pseudomonas extremaustralis]
MSKTISYAAIKIQQSENSKPLVLFAAPATEINDWAGVPQKARISKDESLDAELLGFQRDDDEERIVKISKFYSDPRNVIQNPLLCAIRNKLGINITFTPGTTGDDKPVVDGTVTITCPDLSKLSLLELFNGAKEHLEQRVPDLTTQDPPKQLAAKLSKLIGHNFFRDDEELDNGEDEHVNADDEEPLEEAVLTQSHVVDFWKELSARVLILEKLGTEYDDDEFLGFSREAMEVYLKPVILVDGQHRLKGAIKAAEISLESDEGRWEKIKNMTGDGLTADDVSSHLLSEKSRNLPISLLLDEKADEHVFQFVVVNQKATPVRAALLGTIISTSLADNELQRIADRLESAGIPLQSSVAATYLAKNPESPFAGLVARGLSGDGADLLPWSVLSQLVSIFRNLRGARYFHDSKIDYADLWKRKYLEQSVICDNWNAADFKSREEYWSSPEGPWRDIFIEFWKAVKERLAKVDYSKAPNYWGNPRTSNIFNKPTLLTLTTDFFAYLVESRQTIDSSSQIKTIVDEWLQDIKVEYFSRDWKLDGVKKDSTGTRKQWSSLWFGYRRDPKALPNIKNYSVLYKGN